MKTLTIKDLARTEELGRTEMAAVRGGYAMSPSYSAWPISQPYGPGSDSSLHATQDLKQAQQVFNETADGSAFISGAHVTNTTSQFGQNNLQVGGPYVTALA
jgi:hypothetical protein